MPSQGEDEDVSAEIVATRYSLIKKIGEGSFGQLYKGKFIDTGELVAIKLEKIVGNKTPSLFFEYDRYKRLGKSEGIPLVHFFGPHRDGAYHALVMQLLGKSVEDLYDSCDRRFSLKTILQIVIQMLNRIEYVHGKNIIYRDIKPENFMFGRQESKYRNILYIIDFGLSKEYIDEETGEHIPMKEGCGCLGTARYMSINTHIGKTQSRRDDLEALGYLFVYLCKGKLPWQGLKGTGSERYNRIAQVKKSTAIETLCESLEDEFAEYLRLVRALEFPEKPDYNKLRGLFVDLFKRKKYEKNNLYDWSGRDTGGSSVHAKETASNVKIPPKSRVQK
ncbi:Casein kinase I isoform gamma-1 [Halotydeus destructor]|nr:Casein kinase I isoform gamma-1 [Halotydeus destructor]